MVLEIGPGEGVLTERLAELPNQLVAIEIDPDLAARLRQRFGDRVEIRSEDALEAELPRMTYCAVGNLPYNVGTPILRRVIADPNCRRAVFMLQKEVAERLTARPRGEEYGFLTLYREIFAEARILFSLDPRSFFPPPKVRSSVVALTPRPASLTAERNALIELISASFRMRRKKLVNNLAGYRGLSRETVQQAIAAAGLPETVRAEEMSLAEFDRLAQFAVASPGS